MKFAILNWPCSTIGNGNNVSDDVSVVSPIPLERSMSIEAVKARFDTKKIGNKKFAALNGSVVWNCKDDRDAVTPYPSRQKYKQIPCNRIGIMGPEGYANRMSEVFPDNEFYTEDTGFKEWDAKDTERIRISLGIRIQTDEDDKTEITHRLIVLYVHKTIKKFKIPLRISNADWIISPNKDIYGSLPVSYVEPDYLPPNIIKYYSKVSVCPCCGSSINGKGKQRLIDTGRDGWLGV